LEKAGSGKFPKDSNRISEIFQTIGYTNRTTNMSLFSSKPEISQESFWQEFYSNQLLNPQVEGIDDCLLSYTEVVRDAVAEVSPSFAQLDIERLKHDLLSVRFELFGLFWLHRFGIDDGIRLSAYTRNFLDGRGRPEIWEQCEQYNQSIARSATYGLDETSGMGGARLVKLDTLRIEHFSRACSAGIDPECVARALNRIGTESSWERGVTAGFLAVAISERCGVDLNDDGLFRLSAVVRGFYDGAGVAVDDVKIVG
jgi:hypothetical protein